MAGRALQIPPKSLLPNLLLGSRWGERCAGVRQPGERLDPHSHSQHWLFCISGPSWLGSVYFVATPRKDAFENNFWPDTYLSI